MLKLTIVLLLGLQLILMVHSKGFYLGRSRGGNLGAPGGYNGESLPEARWFKQKLDHTAPSNLKTWKQRYYVNANYFDYNHPGPVFLMIGGEAAADPKWMVKGAWIEYAEKFKALCINLEHRYYGESRPTEDLSTKNLQYLSSGQALGDLAYFIRAMNKEFKLPKDTKWVAFGGSYSGSMAAWLRLKYPHLVYAAVSSSGPLLAKVNFLEYFEVVIDAIREKTEKEECVNEIKSGHQQITSLIRSQPELIEAEFNVCKPFSQASAKDMKNFYNTIANDFAGLVQYNEDNRIGHVSNNLTINTVCDSLTASDSQPAYKKLAKFNAQMQGTSDCLDYSYKTMIEGYRNVTWSNDGERQWMYQTCTEFGFYQTSSAEVELFGNDFPVEFFIEQCQEIFGQKFDKDFLNAAVEWTNDEYGGLDIATSRTVFVQGSVDPWHALGLTKTKSSGSPVIYIRGTAHCANEYPSAESDSAALREARELIRQHLAQWIGLP